MTGRCGGEVKEDFPHHKLKGEGKSRGGESRQIVGGQIQEVFFPINSLKQGEKQKGGSRNDKPKVEVNPGELRVVLPIKRLQKPDYNISDRSNLTGNGKENAKEMCLAINGTFSVRLLLSGSVNGE